MGFATRILQVILSPLRINIRFIVRYNDVESYMQASLDIDNIIWLLDR